VAHIGSGGGFSATHSSMAQNPTARIGQSRTDAAGERDDVIAHRRVDSIGHAIDAKMSEYSVTDWPRMVRITDSRARMCIFVAVTISHLIEDIYFGSFFV
jgi:hypothetical protein